MTVTVERPLGTAADARTLLSADLLDRLATRIVKDHDIALPLAERIAACANNTSQPLTPSKTIDIGWHTFILHTRDYADFCQRVAGHFIHHVPTDPAEGKRGTAAAARQRILDAIATAGYAVDTDLWPEAADCSQCHAGCSDSPNSGKK
ncbi:glycine-rich domain-containing protein [Streptomyces sp. OE57]|uniref:glycine-rich domain-containing protein n=1 Tax=Streptomyces lacaronensis TaxID=3379885 RepID=UPI0039B78AF8